MRSSAFFLNSLPVGLFPPLFICGVVGIWEVARLDDSDVTVELLGVDGVVIAGDKDTVPDTFLFVHQRHG